MTTIQLQSNTVQSGGRSTEGSQAFKLPASTPSNFLRVLQNTPEIAKLLPVLAKIPGAVQWMVKAYAAGASIKYLALAAAMIIIADWNRPVGVRSETRSILGNRFGNLNEALITQFLKLAEQKNVSAESLLSLFKGASNANIEKVIRNLLKPDKAAIAPKNSSEQARQVRELALSLPSCAKLAEALDPARSQKVTIIPQNGKNNIVPLVRQSEKTGSACLMSASAGFEVPNRTPETDAFLRLQGINPDSLSNTVLNISVVNSNPNGSAQITSAITQQTQSGRMVPFRTSTNNNGIRVVNINVTLPPTNGGSFTGSCDGNPAIIRTPVPPDTPIHKISQPSQNQIQVRPNPY